MGHKADFIVRLRCDAFAMFLGNGEKVDLPKRFAVAKANEAVELPVRVDLSDDGRGWREMRVCALKKSKEDIEKAMKRIPQKDSQRQKETSAGAKRFNEYIVRMTSLPGDISADEVLSAYRYRWQVELYFKRLKSLLEMGEIPKKRPESMEAWLNGKMGLAILFEVLLSKLDFFPPCGRRNGNSAVYGEKCLSSLLW